ncbi:MAG: MFS transporter [Chloroflexota bacterium]|nr:MFS transporter [Chloroflexota bacterium]MDE2841529.1 MFS transporter [Chloroflexota bacterium]MDE2931613.1 MFS transporter [Chloroflexota bacterium]
MLDAAVGSADSEYTRSLKRNVWKFYLLKVAWGVRWGTLLPIFAIYFLDRGISLTGFMILMATLNLSSVTSELPTGLFADRFSRKWSIFVGALIGCVGVVILIFAVDYFVFVLGFILVGVGAAFASGADMALFYDSIKGAGLEGRVQSLLGRALAIENISMVGGTLITGAIAGQTGLTGPFWASAASLITAATIALWFVEPDIGRDRPASSQPTAFRETARQYFRHLRATIRTITHNPELVGLVVVYVVLMRTYFLSERPFGGPYLTSLGFSAADLGFIYALFYAVMSAFMLGSGRIRAWLWGSERAALLSLGILGMVSLVVLVNAPLRPIVILGMLGIYVMIGLLHPLMQESLNRRLVSAQRASCLSLVQASIYTLGLLVGTPLGAVADNFGLETGLRAFQWTFVPAILLAAILAWRVLVPSTRRETPASSSGDG